MRNVVVNGRPLETAVESIAALIAELGFANGTVLVEHNGTALRPGEWSAQRLQEGDRIELLRIAAGG